MFSQGPKGILLLFEWIYMELPPLSSTIHAWLERALSIPDTGADDERSAARKHSDALFAEFGAYDASVSIRKTHFVSVEGRQLRIDEYRPRGREHEVLPAFLSLHGGAFRLGHPDELVNVALCAHRAADAGYAVFSLEYRLAPEAPFPAAYNDAVTALSWLMNYAKALKIDASSVVVGGVSAGGNLAAGLSLHARDNNVALAGQILEVPALDLRDDGLWAANYAELNGFSTLSNLRGAYASAREAETPSLSPLLADLKGLAPTHVMIAEYDPLRPGAELFVERLRASANVATATLHLGELHASHGLLRDSRAARLWHAEVVAVLRELASR